MMEGDSMFRSELFYLIDDSDTPQNCPPQMLPISNVDIKNAKQQLGQAENILFF